MNPKEQAEELVVKYKNILPRMHYDVLQETSVACALIAIDEKMEVLQFWIDHPSFTNDHCKPTGFGGDVLTVFGEEVIHLQQVKEELEKM